MRSFGWYESENSILIAMEYMERGDLQRYLHDTIPENETRSIILQLLEGLKFMHEARFAHRDLKPKVRFKPCYMIRGAQVLMAL